MGDAPKPRYVHRHALIFEKGVAEVALPLDAEILHVGIMGGYHYLWTRSASVPPRTGDAPEGPSVAARFRTVNDRGIADGRYVGTITPPHNQPAYHIFW